MTNITKIFSNPISLIYSNSGLISIRKEISNEQFRELSSNIEQLSLRLKNNTQFKLNMDITEELTEIKNANENIYYIIQNNPTSKNIEFSLKYMETINKLFSLIITYYVEKRINKKEYIHNINNIHLELYQKEKYFNKNILKKEHYEEIYEDNEFSDIQAEYYNNRIKQLEKGNFEGMKKVI